MSVPPRRPRLALRTGAVLWAAVALSTGARAEEPATPPAPLDPNGPSCRLGGEVLQAYGIGTPWADLARMAQDVGAAPLRPDLFQRPGDRGIPLCAEGPKLPMGRVAAPTGRGLVIDFVPATLAVYGNTG